MMCLSQVIKQCHSSFREQNLRPKEGKLQCRVTGEGVDSGPRAQLRLAGHWSF